jgi:hypothetical protein
MAKKKAGHVAAKGAARKVTALEDQTPLLRRKAACSEEMLYMRKEVGVQDPLLESFTGLRAATLALWALSISTMAVRILFLSDS